MDINYREDANLHHLCLIFSFMFILNPLCGVFLNLFYIIINRQDVPKGLYYSFFLFLALWLGCINMTKLPSGDMPAYISLFNKVPERGLYNTVFESWGGTGKEPAYSFITFLGYYLCLGNAPLFFCILTTLMYYFIFLSSFKLFRSIGASKAELICGIFSLAFFTQYFVLTAHIVRQMLSMSIMMYAIIDCIVKGKRDWALAIVAIFTHTSSILLFFFSFIPWIYAKMSLKHAVILLFFFVPIAVFNTQIGRFLGSSGSHVEALQYAAIRYSDNASDGLYVPVSLIMMVFVPLGIVAFKTLWTLRHEEEQHILYPVVYLCLMLMLFVLLFTQNPLIQYRYFYYSYAFIPFILPLLFYRSNRNFDRLFCAVVSILFIIRFFLLHNTSGFPFASVSTICFMPFPYYFFEHFYY